MSPILVPTLDELGVEFERVSALYRAACAACAAEPESKAADDAADAASSQLVDLCAHIAALPAQTHQHLRIKAMALSVTFPDGVEPATTDERLAFQLARALLDGLPGMTP